MKETEKIRSSNIELCRMISMLLIIMHHCVYHGGGFDAMSTNFVSACLIMPGGKLCFDTFITISMWFLVGKDFKTERFLKVWFETLFYSLVTAVISVFCFSDSLSATDSAIRVTSALFPMTGAVQGYAATYLAFYLTLPLLNKIADGLTEYQHLFVLCFGFLFFWIAPFIGRVGTEQSVRSRLLFFCFLYFVIFYLRRKNFKVLNSNRFCVPLFVGCWLLIAAIFFFGRINPSCSILIDTFVPDETGLLYTIGGISLFYIFRNLQIKPNWFINLLASTTLGVLLLHDGYFSRVITWEIMHTADWKYYKYYTIYVLGAAISIYLVCSAVDLLRKNVLEKPLFDRKRMQSFCSKVDKWLDF